MSYPSPARGRAPPHPARTMPFEQLLRGLELAKAARLVSRKCDQGTGRSLWCYTNHCVYENGWDEYSLLARGLILDESAGKVVATPFPKFFNAGERGRPIPDGAFDTFEKVDGSLAIIHYHSGRWRVATKGAFDSPQAQWAEARLATCDTAALLVGDTYLAEAIYPENRIVVHYDEAGLVMLGAYDVHGHEYDFVTLRKVAMSLGWRSATCHEFSSFSELVATASTLTANEEGFVMRFHDGLRLKVKGEEYRRIHALISRCTPLAMWEAMLARSDLEQIRQDLPEEFLPDFDAIVSLLQSRFEETVAHLALTARDTSHLLDRELGIVMKERPSDYPPLLFAWRKAGYVLDERIRERVLKDIRPTGNVLAGYTPSYAMARLTEDAA